MKHLLALVLSVIFAQQSAAARAVPLRAVIGLRLAPYVLDNEIGGLEYDYAALILGELGYQLNPLFVPLKDVAPALQKGEADIALTVTDRVARGAAVSRPYIAYRNAAITLSYRHLDIHAIEDLKPYSIAAFDKATLYLGPAFANEVAGKANYSEYGNQLAQNVLLYEGKVDVVIADANIIRYLDAVVAHSRIATVQPVTMFRLFPPSAYCVGFRDAGLRDRFNAMLAHAHQLPGYREIVSRWQGKVGQPIDEILLEGTAPRAN